MSVYRIPPSPSNPSAAGTATVEGINHVDIRFLSFKPLDPPPPMLTVEEAEFLWKMWNRAKFGHRT